MKYQTIYQMWLNGNSVKEIAQEVGLSEVRVRRVLRVLAQEGLIQYPRHSREGNLKQFIESLKNQ